MINTKMMVGAVVLASTLLVGCSKEQPKTSMMQTQLAQLYTDVQIAKSEAQRANQRLDNLTYQYKK